MTDDKVLGLDSTTWITGGQHDLSLIRWFGIGQYDVAWVLLFLIDSCWVLGGVDLA
uniref:Uncharacterized protein n=1 Tax=Fagus sylvatica TaxID=28930 RepID=A0A2N9F8E7_FAGSY